MKLQLPSNEKKSMSRIPAARMRELQKAQGFVLLLWHNHQPPLVRPGSKEQLQPYARMHAMRGYRDMPRWVEAGGIHASFNMTPSLIEQLELYLQGGTDSFLDHTMVRADKLTREQKYFILDNFFINNYDHAIKPFPRYRELLEKKSQPKSYSIKDWRDLQVWFNLAMFGFGLRTENKEIQRLIEKGRNYSEADKQRVIEIQKQVIREVLTCYRHLQETGSIAVTVSPYAHPVLPLIIDQQIALAGLPGARLPQFSHPDDARAQLHLAGAIYERTFGRPPLGMWPPEGGVSPEIVPLIRQAAPSIRYLLTDVDIRHGSQPWLGNNWWEKFQPWETGGLNIFFRDRKLSDDISYVKMDRYPLTVREMIANICTIIGGAHGKGPSKPVVSIVLDGENLQIYRSNDAHDFIAELYHSLASNPQIATILPEEYLALYPHSGKLTSLASGSWIARNFSTWTGDPLNHAGYGRIHQAEGWLEKLEVQYSLRVDPLKRARIHKELYQLAARSNLFASYGQLSPLARVQLLMLQAESSCFRWWFGGTSGEEADLGAFDRQFRRLLVRGYRELGLPVPPELFVSLYSDRDWAAGTKIE